MKVLITGITGFVGSHLADYILDNQPEVEVHGTKRWRSPLDNIEDILSKVTLHDCDIKDLSSLIITLRKVKPDKIFHLAAQSYVPYSYIAPVDTLMTNVIGTASLLEAVRLTEQDPLIHICSSSEVYGQVKKEDTPIKETQPLNPVSPYAVGKVAQDMLGLQYYTSWGLKTVRTRYFTHTGARRSEVFVCSNFAKQIAKVEAGLQEPIVRVGNLDSVRTFVDVRDTIRSYWMLNKGMAGEAYNIGGNRTMTIGEMLKLLLSLSTVPDTKIVVDQQLLRPADVTLQIPDCTKSREATGWKPRIPFEETLESLLNYWRKKVKK